MYTKHILIIFLNIIWKLTFIKGLSSCLSESGKVRFCEPDFINVAHNATIKSTSTCGQQQTEKICLKWYSSTGEDVGKCIKCDDRIPELSKNISLVFDRHIQNKETYWVSGGIPKSSGIHSINITINLNKLYEVYYIIVEFSSQLPDSMVLYKSNDYGKTWLPWNYFSSSCKKTFKMKKSKPLQINHEKGSQKINPACFSFKHSVQNMSSNYKVVPFNPMTGRNSLSFDTKLVKEWVSLTDMMISLLIVGSKKRNKLAPEYLSISDVTIGGRGQCYGHAKSLIKKNGTLICECTHGTTGQDCSKCLKTHNDQPWKIIFPTDLMEHVCERCFCNNHAEECEFDEKIYENTSRKHGSRCLNCLHNTVGYHCDSCSPGYYRNRAFPINHPQVCQKCGCHPYGSVFQSHCHPDTGNCQCKNGVEGKLCNRCKKGYQQTKSSVSPCAPDTASEIMGTEERCDTCGKNRPRIRFRKFCKKHIMIKISIQSKEIHGEWTRFEVRVLKIWRIQQSLKSQVNLYEYGDSTYPIWVENADIRCKCPNFTLGHTYLLLTKIKLKTHQGQSELIVDRKSSALDWNDDWVRRLDMFKKREEHGKCDRFQYKRKHSRLVKT